MHAVPMFMHLPKDNADTLWRKLTVAAAIHK